MATILIWGDTQDSCILARRVLEKQQHRVMVFTRADDAINWADQHHPEMAILDAKESAASLAVLESLKNQIKHIHIVMTTTESPSSIQVKRMKNMGAEVFFSSPIEIDILEKRASRFSDSNKGGGD
jgi:DNA-binding NtrC family response regulator